MDNMQQLQLLKKEYPHAKYYLNFSNPLELLVAAILSAQCKDEIVNATTKFLFKKYKTAKDFSNLDERDVKSITFFKNKAANIRKAANELEEKYHGTVPKTIEELIKLPGIGEKTAHAILQNVFNVVEGIVVDTHVIRISWRLGWTKNKSPEKIEQDLEKLFPKNHWKELPHLLKSHGRAVCRAPMPACSKCVLDRNCPKIDVIKNL